MWKVGDGTHKGSGKAPKKLELTETTVVPIERPAD